MTHEQMIEVIQAHKEGKKIEFKTEGLNGWQPASTPTWNFSNYNYRVKPEDKYVPFTFATNLVGKVVKHSGTLTEMLIIRKENQGVLLGNYNHITPYKELLDSYTFLDNTPCGNKQ